MTYILSLCASMQNLQGGKTKTPHSQRALPCHLHDVLSRLQCQPKWHHLESLDDRHVSH